jgi:hypothetical protein
MSRPQITLMTPLLAKMSCPRGWAWGAAQPARFTRIESGIIGNAGSILYPVSIGGNFGSFSIFIVKI